MNDVETGEHVGTHMDAPAHFCRGKWHVNDIPPERLIGPAVMVDIRYKASLDTPDVNVTLEDLQNWEMQYGRIPDGAVVFMCSGWYEHYDNETIYKGNDVGDLSDYHFPGFDPEGAQWLFEERKAIGVGSDSPSTDYGASQTFPSHLIICGHDAFGLENVKNTCLLPPNGAMAYVFPIKSDGGSGGPTRVMAVWGDEHPTTSTPAPEGSNEDLTTTARGNDNQDKATCGASSIPEEFPCVLIGLMMTAQINLRWY